MTDTHEDDGEGDENKKKKKKKAHRGYAFIVYERERDMKSITSYHKSKAELFKG